MRLLFELHEIWSVDSRENCGVAAGRLNFVGSVPATGSRSNHETVGDLMGEVSARCIEALSATTSSMEGGTLQRQQTTVMKE